VSSASTTPTDDPALVGRLDRLFERRKVVAATTIRKVLVVDVEGVARELAIRGGRAGSVDSDPTDQPTTSSSALPVVVSILCRLMMRSY
jgi:hypothetical protein